MQSPCGPARWSAGEREGREAQEQGPDGGKGGGKKNEAGGGREGGLRDSWAHPGPGARGGGRAQERTRILGAGPGPRGRRRPSGGREGRAAPRPSYPRGCAVSPRRGEGWFPCSRWVGGKFGGTVGAWAQEDWARLVTFLRFLWSPGQQVPGRSWGQAMLRAVQRPVPSAIQHPSHLPSLHLPLLSRSFLAPFSSSLPASLPFLPVIFSFSLIPLNL